MTMPSRRNTSSLIIVERAFRGAVREQYGHIVWLARIMREMGARCSLLLRGNAVLYARRDQARLGLDLGRTRVDHLPHYESAIELLLARGVEVYADADALTRLCPDAPLVAGVITADRTRIVQAIVDHDRAWYW
jgi:hypothetical protein